MNKNLHSESTSHNEKKDITANQESYLRYLLFHRIYLEKLKYVRFLHSNNIPKKVLEKVAVFSTYI